MSVIATLATGTIGFSLGTTLGYTIQGILGAITLGSAGGYSGVKIGERNLIRYFSNKLSKNDLEIINIVKSYLFTGTLSGLAYWLSTEDLNLYCNTLVNATLCSPLENMSFFATSSACLSLLYSVYKTNKLYQKREFCIQTWKVNDHQITVLCKEGVLYYKVLDTISKKISSDSFKPDSTSLKQKISHLKQCEVVLNKKGVPTFLKPIFTWENSSRKISLIYIGTKEKFLWQLSDTSLSALQVQSNYPNIVFTNRDSCLIANFLGRLNKLNSLPIEICISICKGIEVAAVKKFNRKSSKEGLFQVTFKPVSQLSRIDSRVLISQFYWGVTLICYNGFMDNHAQIIVEGLEEGKYFMHLAHMKGENSIESTIVSQETTGFTPEKLQWKERTIVWKKKSEKVKEMLRDIEKDIENPPAFSLLGRDSILGDKGDNCFTWARNHMKSLKIELGNSPLDYLAARTKNYTLSPEDFQNSPYPKNPNCKDATKI